MNRSAPFWDFVAGLEQEGANHPFFSQFNRNSEGNAAAEAGPGHAGPEGLPFGAWGWGFPFGGDRGIPHHRGPPPPAGRHAPHHEREERDEDKDFEKDFERELNREFDEDSDEKSELKNDDKEKDNGEGPSGTGTGSDAEGCCHRRGGRRGEQWGPRRGRHGCGPRGWGGPGPHGHGHERGFGHGHGHGHGRRGGWGGWRGRSGPFGGNHPFNPLAFASSLFEADTAKPSESDDFSPDADIFDTPEAFVVHVSLPGAKKEDVGVNWDVEKSELQIAGVIYRPGDEKLLEQLAMTERKVGAFERKIRLGTRANPANVDADQISAKLEDGVLRVNVPKMGENGFVEIRKVDIE
jgi:HSP20 family protein